VRTLAIACCLCLTGCGSYGPALVGAGLSAVIDINQDWVTGQLPWLKVKPAVATPASGSTAPATP
jgi:hypothetical protein